eukprot:gnl/TRDRNA2_/TRDRNA2_193301_c0_seq1.p1 gnl/TRDRNA2_/TRDRNA2_193301_c0~~gnl/TRDRNA2_/TRDRNA2_193301_c0_seq1.p1  ORF type:complete len:258 (+),score=33.67 gnl/TRDRNA2_/TRDRNA2_193301_c0_seq1:88-861(+)
MDSIVNRILYLIRSDGYDWMPTKGLYAEVMLGHTLYTICETRAEAEKSGKKGADALYDAASSFVLYGYGGSMCRDMILGQPTILFSHGPTVKAWLLCHWLVRGSPWKDAIFATVRQRGSPTRLLLTALEATDEALTIVGTVEGGQRAFKGSPTVGPIILAVITAASGGWLRRIHGGQCAAPSSLLAQPGVRAGLFISIVTILLQKMGFKSLGVRLFLTAYCVSKAIAAEISLKPLPDHLEPMSRAWWFSDRMLCASA